MTGRQFHGWNQTVTGFVDGLMPMSREDLTWPVTAIHVGASMFVFALAASVFFDPSIWVLHAFQALIYVAVMVLAQRESPLGFGAGFAIALLWNGANLFATGFIAAALHTLHTALSTGHILRPVLLLVLVGAAGHLLMIAGSLACFLRSGSVRRQWARFLGGAILGVIALALISPLRFRLHEQPLPLDVAPQYDVLTVLAVAGLSGRAELGVPAAPAATMLCGDRSRRSG